MGRPTEEKRKKERHNSTLLLYLIEALLARCLQRPISHCDHMLPNPAFIADTVHYLSPLAFLPTLPGLASFSDRASRTSRRLNARPDPLLLQRIEDTASLQHGHWLLGDDLLFEVKLNSLTPSALALRAVKGWDSEV